jgi:hypothetical protein
MAATGKKKAALGSSALVMVVRTKAGKVMLRIIRDIT